MNANRIAKWNGSAWSPLGTGTNNLVRILTVFDDGTGPALYAGGSFTSAGGVAANNIAKWDGIAWSPLGKGMNGIFALTVFDDGTGDALYAGGDFTVAGGVTANGVARWNGTAWSPLGKGINGTVLAMTAFDDGTGEALYVGGIFGTAGGVAANNIARWNGPESEGGSDWSPLDGPAGNGMNNVVYALTKYDDGTGPALYAGGLFTTAGGVTVNRIAKWDGPFSTGGTGWSPLGTGIGGSSPYVLTLTDFDDGTGPALYAGGGFTEAGEVAANYIAAWNGKFWSPLGSGMGGSDPFVSSIKDFDDGTGPALYIGGAFTTAGGLPSANIAKWYRPAPPCPQK